MALRAGYYGIKRKLKNKLEIIASEWDATVKDNPIINTKFIVYKKVLTVAAGASVELEIPAQTGMIPVQATAGFRGGGATGGSAFSFIARTDSAGFNTCVIRNISGTDREWTITLAVLYMTAEYVTVIDLDANRTSTAAAPEEIVKEEIIEEPIAIKKTTTRKKSTAKAETQEEV